MQPGCRPSRERFTVYLSPTPKYKRLVGTQQKFKKDISFAMRRGTIAQVTTALDAAQRAAEEKLAVNDVGLAW